MDKNPSLEKEILLLMKKARFLDALKRIDFALDQDPNSHQYYYLRGAANIFLQRIDDALMDLGEAVYLNPQHIPSMHALAYVFLKKEDYEGAFNKWISILELNPKDRLAKIHLKRFRKTSPSKATLNLNPDLYLQLPKVYEIRKSSEKPAKKRRMKSVWLTGLLFLLILSAVIIGLRFFSFQPGTVMAKLFNFSPDQEIAYSFTDKELDFYKKQIYDLVSRQQYNQARLLLNKVYLSNASLDDKKLLKTWEARLEYPSTATLDTQFTPEEIFTNWKIAQGCFVLWSGEAQAVTQKNQYLFFQLKVPGPGSVGAVLFSNFPLQNQEKVRVLGKIQKISEKELELEIYHIEKL